MRGFLHRMFRARLSLVACALFAAQAQSVTPYLCAFAGQDMVINNKTGAGLVSMSTMSGIYPDNQNNPMPRYVVTYRAAVMPAADRAVTVVVNFWMNPSIMDDCLMPCVWNPFPADSYDADAATLTVGLPMDLFDEFSKQHIEPYDTASAGSGACFTFAPFVSCQDGQQASNNTITSFIRGKVAGYAHPCTSCAAFTPYPSGC